MVLITVLTPTYNRASSLKKCYDSLLRQSCKNFEWFIVDDGSTDDTALIVENFIMEKKVSIKYMKKNNGGKHTALNYGIKKINSDLVVILDSDDYLTEDAIEQIMFYYNKYKESKKLCGFSFLKLHPTGEVIGDKFPKDEEIASFINMRLNRKVRGDKCEVFFTKCLKEYPFPEFEGEKFIGESTVWVQMGLKYDMVHINKGIYVGIYKEDGLTRQGRKMRILCPFGGMEYAKMCMIKQCHILLRIKSAALYCCYAFFAKKTVREIILESQYTLLTIFTLPFGRLLFHYWSLKYKPK